jgi:hypothetical protein
MPSYAPFGWPTIQATNRVPRMTERLIGELRSLLSDHAVVSDPSELLMPYLFDEATISLFSSRIKHAFDLHERINAGKLIPSDKITVRLLKPGRKVPQ